MVQSSLSVVCIYSLHWSQTEVSKNGSDIHVFKIEMLKSFFCIHCKNFCGDVHPFEDAAIGVSDEMNAKGVRVSNEIYLAIEGH